MEEKKTKNTEKGAEKVNKTAEAAASKLKQGFNTFSKNLSKNHTIKFLASTVKNPTTAIKENISNYSEFKKAWQLPVIIGLIYTIISLINLAISKVYVPAHKSFFGKQIDAVWSWNKLEQIDWLKELFTQFFAYLIPLLFVAGIYYLVALVFKKKANFFRLVTIVTIASIPAILATFILAPIAGAISPTFAFVVLMSGISYGSIMAYENLNAEINYQTNERVFANVLFMIVTYLILAILFDSLLKSALGGKTIPFDSLNNLLNN